ncbi:hypothetical protein EYZ11_011713 [Aspergillus tanneri]|uniref:(2E,6E)-farnesyl diphosphate synthase n=1 Tax=Aspergillus tanneri TaxID=1220188 RepID=A0A4S3J228_9EURO|nr:terpene cyclase [Aspergillus tanneri]KAA8652643.1 terpene cyclase [Aspergillus tanneri]THC88839.1 hypothetical protein EYZ11_011713 [Aspergillus tanneri]
MTPVSTNGAPPVALPNVPFTNPPASCDEQKVVRSPLDYLLNVPGKDLRKKLISAFQVWLEVSEEKLQVINSIVGLLHTASLMIDDIQDGSKLRRGIPVAHAVFGVAQTINSANYAYFLAQQELAKLGNPKAFEIFTEEMLNLHCGQGMDLYWRESLVCPTEEEYLRMVSNKTGGLFRLAIRLMQMASESDLDCVPLVDLLGVMFQIRDDYQNLQSDSYSKNKGFGEDLSEGKFSFPIIHSIRSNPADLQLLNILIRRTDDDDVKHAAIRYIDSTGSFDYCRQRLREIGTAARDMVHNMSGDADAVQNIYRIIELFELSA